MTTILIACEPTVKKADTAQHKVIFLSDNSFQSNRETIKEIIDATLLECNKYLQNDGLTFNISPTTPEDKEIIKEMGGVTGITHDDKHISITIDTNIISWKEILKYTVAHEYHHAYCINSYDEAYRWTLLDYIVFEGNADSFAHLIYPNIIAAWTTALSETEKSALWVKISPDLQSKDDSLHNEVMFGGKTYPIWGGYTLGFNIVQSALKNNPNLTVKAWTNLTASEMLEMSDYKCKIHTKTLKK